jgi:hypothetical protein
MVLIEVNFMDGNYDFNSLTPHNNDENTLPVNERENQPSLSPETPSSRTNEAAHILNQNGTTNTAANHNGFKANAEPPKKEEELQKKMLRIQALNEKKAAIGV